MALWDGRFGEKPDAEMIAFGESLSVDLAMLDEDVAGSKAHATMLGEVGLLTVADVATLHAGLDAVRDEIATRAWVPGPEHEDVHMAVEARLTEKVGAVGGRLHTASIAFGTGRANPSSAAVRSRSIGCGVPAIAQAPNGHSSSRASASDSRPASRENAQACASKWCPSRIG